MSEVKWGYDYTNKVIYIHDTREFRLPRKVSENKQESARWLTSQVELMRYYGILREKGWRFENVIKYPDGVHFDIAEIYEAVYRRYYDEKTIYVFGGSLEDTSDNNVRQFIAKDVFGYTYGDVGLSGNSYCIPIYDELGLLLPEDKLSENFGVAGRVLANLKTTKCFTSDLLGLSGSLCRIEDIVTVSRIIKTNSPQLELPLTWNKVPDTTPKSIWVSMDDSMDIDDGVVVNTVFNTLRTINYQTKVYLMLSGRNDVWLESCMLSVGIVPIRVPPYWFTQSGNARLVARYLTIDSIEEAIVFRANGGVNVNHDTEALLNKYMGNSIVKVIREGKFIKRDTNDKDIETDGFNDLDI